jgi:hypothetical protein
LDVEDMIYDTAHASRMAACDSFNYALRHVGKQHFAIFDRRSRLPDYSSSLSDYSTSHLLYHNRIHVTWAKAGMYYQARHNAYVSCLVFPHDPYCLIMCFTIV